MNVSKTLLVALRLAMGWIFFYAGISKILDPAWSAGPFLNASKTLPSLYHWFASPGVLPIINFVNEWGLLLLGISLVLGVFVRLSSTLGVVLMVLYYLAQLDFPYIGTNGLLVDQHVIFILVLLLLANARAGRVWGLETWCSNLPICSRFPVLRKLLG